VIDEVVEPAATKSVLAVALAQAQAAAPGVRGKHGNIPL